MLKNQRRIQRKVKDRERYFTEDMLKTMKRVSAGTKGQRTDPGTRLECPVMGGLTENASPASPSTTLTG